MSFKIETENLVSPEVCTLSGLGVFYILTDQGCCDVTHYITILPAAFLTLCLALKIKAKRLRKKKQLFTLCMHETSYCLFLAVILKEDLRPTMNTFFFF